MRVLIVDDEPDIRHVLSRALGGQGMRVDTAADGASALEHLKDTSYDVVLLDVLMPGPSGIDLLPLIIKDHPDVRVLMISAVNEPRSRLKCFELGAVDYLSKPFILAEVVARVRVHTRPELTAVPPLERRLSDRRAAGRRAADRELVPAAPEAVETGRYLTRGRATLDRWSRAVVTDGVTVGLSERESLVLTYLMQRVGDVCTREEILDTVWGPDGASTGNVVDVYVGRLRAKLPADTITTIRNAGYAFNAA
ncbi:MAG: two-component system, OmpR family, response regulator [Actinomycetota bacterium]|jgi:DNA-binding response OmpR family regulator|nr:two-component system, OmpR family, response regulator [Actinomycetota bacterium]